METKTLDVSPLQIKANRLDLLGRLTEELAHEIKNPLHSMVISLELLKRRVAAGEADGALERARILEAEIARLDRLLDGLLHLLRTGDDEEAQAVDLDAALHELLPVLEPLARLARVTLDVQPAGTGATVLIRPGALRHAVLNLVANALDAMRPAGGRLELHCTTTPEHVLLRIHDTGPGVPPHARPQPGTPGLSTAPDSTALGIAVSRALLEAAGGRLELQPRRANHGGTTLLLTLPRAPRA